jgi:hypothetical protein
MAVNWFFQIMGDVNGPVTSAQLKRLAAIGNISVDTLVRKGEGGNWVSAEQVQGLFDQAPQLVPDAPPPPPPPDPPPRLAERISGSNGNMPPSPSPPAVKDRRLERSQPKSLWERLVYFLDPMFERFLTPWIIRVTWVLLLIVAVLVTIIFGYGHVSLLASLKPDLSEVERAEERLAAANSFLQQLLEEKREREIARQPSRDSGRPRPFQTRDEPSENTEPPRSADPLEEAKQMVASAESRLAEVRAKLPSKMELAGEHLPLQALLYILELAACTIAVLWLRVILEGGIVLFSIVTKLGSIDERLANLNRPGIPPTT